MSLVISVDSSGRQGLLEGLEAELSARGAAVEVLDQDRQPGLAPESVPATAAILARHGVLVIVRSPFGPCSARVVQVTEGDLLDPESRKALFRRLELLGSIPPSRDVLSEDEEAIIRERLQKLGYL